jgi:ABC-type polysaccharide/polyol phosphate transport system ATPase subunit
MTDLDNAIEVVELVKDFKIYHRTFATLKGHATALIGSLLRRGDGYGYDIRRALNKVTFSIRTGETVAIIGRNGSGKSTLLSVLSRIYLPTSGEIRITGRVVSLLELGGSFDVELTGEQNLIFNAVIMGLTDRQVQERLAAIIEFSELDESVLALPVRMYSSGMQMRLAFAIAVNVDADVLLVDEGLAVGDEGFQQKCFAKIDEFKRLGKTIVMVTHSLDQTGRFADRVIWLDNGNIRRDGTVEEVVPEYRANF